MHTWGTIIVDDHPGFCSVLRQFVESLPKLSFAGEAEDGGKALKLVASLKPKLVLMDIVMPHMSGVEACRTLKSQLPAPVVVLYSASDFEIESARDEKVADYCVVKDELFDVLPELIRDLCNHPAGM